MSGSLPLRQYCQNIYIQAYSATPRYMEGNLRYTYMRGREKYKGTRGRRGRVHLSDRTYTDSDEILEHIRTYCNFTT